MTNYSNYEYYISTYKGAVLDAASFDLFARKATRMIKRDVFNRIDETDIPEEVKMCCCELAEATYKHEKSEDNGNITSEKVGEYSVSYVGKEEQERVFRANCYRIIVSWLSDTGLLYRGCY